MKTTLTINGTLAIMLAVAPMPATAQTRGGDIADIVRTSIEQIQRARYDARDRYADDDDDRYERRRHERGSHKASRNAQDWLDRARERTDELHNEDRNRFDRWVKESRVRNDRLRRWIRDDWDRATRR